MASAVSALTGSSASSSAAALASSSSSSSSSASSTTSAPSEETFLKLLVSQLQNQDPLNPTDSTQFVAELAQFSELEQVIAIRGDIEKGSSQSTPSPTASAQSSTSDTPSTKQTQL
jgi:flagellar basal-body rod modification protein FlgD